MAKQKTDPQDAGTETPTLSETPPDQGSKPPQGIVIRYLETGDPKKDFHPYRREKQMIDPESLIVDGKHPVLSMPIQNERVKRRCVRVDAKHAALLLTCDWATGGQSTERLATDEEVAQMEAEEEYRRQHSGHNAE